LGSKSCSFLSNLLVIIAEVFQIPVSERTKLFIATLMLSVSILGCSIPDSAATSTTTDPNEQNCSSIIEIWNEYLFTINWYVDLWNENINGVSDSSSVMLEMGSISDKLSALDDELQSLSKKVSSSGLLQRAISNMRRTTSDPGKFISEFEEIFPQVKQDRQETLSIIESTCN
jgi:hypothetical protein